MKRITLDKIKMALSILIAVLLLTTAYHANCYDSENKLTYTNLYSNSEPLVYGEIYGCYEGLTSLRGYGLGWYTPYNSITKGNYDTEDGIYCGGYNVNDTSLAVEKNGFTEMLYVEGHTMKFQKGMECKIKKVKAKKGWLFVDYESDVILTNESAGRLDFVKVCDEKGDILPNGDFSPYESQIGLQGKVWAFLGKLFSVRGMDRMPKLVTSLFTACAAVFVCVLLAKKWNRMAANIFFLFFWLAPLPVAFGSNLYWMEGIWFLMIAAGILFSMHWREKRERRLCCLAAFLLVAVKSACGYEYITTVMVLLEVFLVAEFAEGFAAHRKREEQMALFRAMAEVGAAALLAFFAVIAVHALLRGEGNFLAGLKRIYEEDVLRRTLGGNPAAFDGSYTESLNASVGEVVGKYFYFSNSLYTYQIILGIDGAFFLPLCVISAVLAICGVCNGKITVGELAVYAMFFLAAVSWFVFGKSHSAAHPFLNFILWYLGYIQMVFYIIVRYVYNSIARERTEKQGVNG